MNGSQNGLALEVVAAITSVLAVVMERPVGSFVVTSIQAEQPTAQPAAQSAWPKAGLLESHLARRQFGLRLR